VKEFAAGRAVGVRWTIGDVSDNGWKALRLSILGARRGWLEHADARECLLAEDTIALFGQFTPYCGPEPRNAGIVVSRRVTHSRRCWRKSPRGFA
jgi:hypothetical protein